MAWKHEPEPVILEAAPWGDGSSPPGWVNIIDRRNELVIAQDVDKDFAEEMCRRWNAYNKKEPKDGQR